MSMRVHLSCELALLAFPAVLICSVHSLLRFLMKIGLEFLKLFKFTLSVNVMSNCQNNKELFWRCADQKKLHKCQNTTYLIFVKIASLKREKGGYP